jgi:CRP/FNR family transcriptional regulator, nitrogen fixation regulation protein
MQLLLPVLSALEKKDTSVRAASQRAFARGAEVFAEGDPSTFFFKVVSGTVRTVKLLSDGRRQIEGFTSQETGLAWRTARTTG